MARAKRDAAQRLLEQQAREVFDAPQIAGPQPANYGVYGPAFAAASQVAAQDPYFGGANRIGLQLHSMGEDRAYAEELERTRAAQLEAQDRAAYYNFMEKTMRDAGDVPIGTYNVGMAPNGRASVTTDPAYATAQNALELDAIAAESYQKRASGLHSAAQAGFAPPPEDVTALLRNSLETPENAVRYNLYETPAVAVERYGKNQGMTVEQQFSMEQLKQAGALERTIASANSANSKWKAVINPNVIDPATGEPQVTYTFTGTPDELAAQGLSPPGGGGTRPRAGAQAPGASATQGSRNLVPVTDAKSVATSLFPAIHITEHRRDPNSRLGRANPDSWHNRSGAAVDSRRLPGMTFDQYVQRYKDAGYEIIEARDEYTNPSPHATGKHWHVVLGQRRQQPARTPQSRGEAPVRLSRIEAITQRASQRGMNVQADEATNTILITSTDGKTTKRFDMNGNEIGG